MVPPVSRRVSRAPRYSGCRPARAGVPRTGLSPSTAARSFAFRYPSLAFCRPYNPGCAWTHPVWAPPRSLATTWGITIVFSSCGYLDVSVPHVRPRTRCGWRAFSPPGCPIRKSADRWPFAPPRGLSQLITSFFASSSLGIHRPPLSTFSLLRAGRMAGAALVLFSSSFHHVKDLVRPSPDVSWRIRGSNP